MKAILILICLCLFASVSLAAPLTAGYMPKAKSGTAINDSAVYQNVTNIGIGSTNARGKLDVAGAIWVDGSIYQAGTMTGGVGLWLSQPDGGCSLCGPDNAGTTFACTNQTCPTGM